jgi:phage virion morphogenesis protein
MTAVNAAIKSTVDRVKHQEPMWNDIGFELLKSVEANFDAEGRPAWEDWDPAYGEMKEAGDKILTASGQLRRSMTHDPDSSGVTIGSDLEYAAIHQFGGKTKPHEIRARHAQALHFFMGQTEAFAKVVQHPGSVIPARPFLKFTDDDWADVAHIIEQHLMEDWD